MFCRTCRINAALAMNLLKSWIHLLLLCAIASPNSGEAASHVSVNSDQVLVIDGKKVFPVGFTMPPPADGKAPNGKDGIGELRDAGATFLRTGVMGGPWNEAAIAKEESFQDAAAKHGMHCWVFLRELGSIEENAPKREAMLRKVVTAFRDHPGMGVWKGEDEPEWGKKPVPPLVHARKIIRELDTNHPVAVTHAPRGTVESLRPYNVSADITGADIYPIGYPPGGHSLETNKEISMVGDYTRRMMEVADGKKPVWMILQIAWSGVIKTNKTLRMPTFAEERFMVYEAIINGARGLFFFGGHLPQAMNHRDKQLGWNWTFWDRVLRPVVEEIGEKSPLYPALVAPNSKLPVKCNASDVEFCVREVGTEIFVLACKRGGATRQVAFSGLPANATGREMLFEEPRRVKIQNGKFTDWFAPYEVHVYRFSR
jgi:hypothetical protein